jgi:beta-glucanase (GH16 family)
LEWEPGVIRWYLDGQIFSAQTNWRSEGGPFPAPFDQPFYLLLNLSVGGNWPGPPDAQTVFPQRMLVDYVRVYQRTP